MSYFVRNIALRTRSRGQATVEFALVLPILLLFVFGTIEFGNAFWKYQQVSAAASEGARKAAVSRSSATRTSDVQNAVYQTSPALAQANLTVATTSLWTPASSVTVKVTYRLDSIGMNLLSTLGFSGNLTSTRTTRVEQ